jgi:DNA polymerase
VKKYRTSLDFETYCDVSVVDVGVDRYSRHPSLRVLMCAYSIDDGPVRQWVPEEGEERPEDLFEALRDPMCIKQAWNKSFEWSILANHLGIVTPHNEWYDPMVLAYSLAFPGSLDKVGQILRLPEDKRKMSRGKALIRKFCGPRKPTKNDPRLQNHWYDHPKDWEEFLLYNRTDVEAEREIYRRLQRFDMPQHEWENWYLDQEINQVGIPINMKLVDDAVRVYDELFFRRVKEMKELSGLANPMSNAQLLPWLRDRGYPYTDLQKGKVKRAYSYFDEKPSGFTKDQWESYRADSVLKRMLELRLEASKSSPKKFRTLSESADREAGVIRNAFQFAGAGRTWRWAGRMFQAQNLAKPTKEFEHCLPMAAEHLEKLDVDAIELMYDKPFDLLSSCVRPVAQAPEGYVFIDADLSAIENRALGWICGCKKILQVFLDGRDPYVDFATRLFGASYESLWAEYLSGNKYKRTMSKPGVLGCGYRLGPGEKRINKQTGEEEATGLLGYAWNMGIRDFTEEQSRRSVEVFRSAYPEVVAFWTEIERAAKYCVRTGRPIECGPVRFEFQKPFLRMRLPSGRYLSYLRPKILDWKTPWGAVKPTLTYEGLNDRGIWARIPTQGGKLLENSDQGISRDLLVHGMRIAKDRYGMIPRIHVHDQIVACAPIETAERDLARLIECMEEAPSWAEGLPLGAAGFVSKIFTKD